MNYNVIDIYSKLLLLLFRHMNGSGTPDQIKAQRLGMLNKILGVAVRTMMWDFEKKNSGDGATKWDQRPWFRLLLNLVIDMNKPDPAFDPIRLGILSVFGAAFHVCQPLGRVRHGHVIGMHEISVIAGLEVGKDLGL